MEDGFELAARAKVLRLRSMADELEAWLARYAGEGTGGLPQGQAQFADAVATAGAAVPPPSKKGRNAPLLSAIEAAGATGLTVEEVHRAAFDAGLRPNRATIRSFLWNQRKSGRLVGLQDGRHVLAKHAHTCGHPADVDAPSTGGDGDQE